MAEIVFYYKHEYRCELSEEDYDKIIEYADEHEITLEDAYLELESNGEIYNYRERSIEYNSEFYVALDD
jgi:hypothetical protein